MSYFYRKIIRKTLNQLFNIIFQFIYGCEKLNKKLSLKQVCCSPPILKIFPVIKIIIWLFYNAKST